MRVRGYMMSVFGFPAIVFYGLENQLLASNASMRLMHRQKERKVRFSTA